MIVYRAISIKKAYFETLKAKNKNIFPLKNTKTLIKFLSEKARNFFIFSRSFLVKSKHFSLI